MFVTYFKNNFIVADIRERLTCKLYKTGLFITLYKFYKSINKLFFPV